MKTKETKNAAVNRKEELYGVILISILLTSMLTVMSVGAFVRSEKGKNPVQTLMVAVRNGFENDGYEDGGYGDETYDDSDFPPYETYPQTDSEDITETDPDETTEQQETTGPADSDTDPDQTDEATDSESVTSGDTTDGSDPANTGKDESDTTAETDLPVIIKPGDDTETTAAVTDPPVTTTAETEAQTTKEPETEPPVTTAPVTTAPETTAPVTTAPETTAPETTAPVTTTPQETEPPIKDEDLEYFSDALFIGDSRTVGLAAYGKIEGATYFARTSANVKNLFNNEKSGTEKSGLNLTDFLKEYKFGKIYILLGINEIGYSFDWIVGNYAADIAKIRELQPDAKIIIQSNMHVTKAKSDANPKTFNNARLDELNRRLALLADNKTVFFVDICPAFDDENGVMPAKYSGDGVHLYGKYYPLWRDYLIRYCRR